MDIAEVKHVSAAPGPTALPGNTPPGPLKGTRLLKSITLSDMRHLRMFTFHFHTACKQLFLIHQLASEPRNAPMFPRKESELAELLELLLTQRKDHAARIGVRMEAEGLERGASSESVLSVEINSRAARVLMALYTECDRYMQLCDALWIEGHLSDSQHADERIATRGELYTAHEGIRKVFREMLSLNQQSWAARTAKQEERDRRRAEAKAGAQTTEESPAEAQPPKPAASEVAVAAVEVAVQPTAAPQTPQPKPAGRRGRGRDETTKPASTEPTAVMAA